MESTAVVYYRKLNVMAVGYLWICPWGHRGEQPIVDLKTCELALKVK
jgi:hypothetical protein